MRLTITTRSIHISSLCRHGQCSAATYWIATVNKPDHALRVPAHLSVITMNYSAQLKLDELNRLRIDAPTHETDMKTPLEIGVAFNSRDVCIAIICYFIEFKDENFCLTKNCCGLWLHAECECSKCKSINLLDIMLNRTFALQTINSLVDSWQRFEIVHAFRM